MQKAFGDKIYTGTVIDIDVDKKGKTMWRVRYDDGDEEDLYEEELRPLLGVTPTLKAQRYLTARTRAINLFKHYPVLKITIHPGRGQQRDRFFNGDYSVKLGPLTPFPASSSGTTADKFANMFGTGHLHCHTPSITITIITISPFIDVVNVTITYCRDVRSAAVNERHDSTGAYKNAKVVSTRG